MGINFKKRVGYGSGNTHLKTIVFENRWKREPNAFFVVHKEDPITVVLPGHPLPPALLLSAAQMSDVLVNYFTLCSRTFSVL